MTLAIVPNRLDPEATPLPIDDLPPFSSLRLIEAACRHGNYTRAARECGVSHPAISAQVQKLEARLGTPLFRRENLCMRPTPAAVNLAGAYREARAILDSAVRRATSFPAPSLVVGTSADFARLWLAPRLGGILAALSGAALEFRCLDPDPAGPWDVYIGHGPDPRAGIVQIPLLGEALQAFCSPALARGRGFREPLDLCGAPLLQHRPGDWRDWFGSQGLTLGEPFLGMTFDEVADMVEAAADGAGIALVSAGMAEGALRAGRLVRLFDHELLDDEPLVLSWRADTDGCELVDRLHRWVATELRAGRRIVGAPRRGC